MPLAAVPPAGGPLAVRQRATLPLGVVLEEPGGVARHRRQHEVAPRQCRGLWRVHSGPSHPVTWLSG